MVNRYVKLNLKLLKIILRKLNIKLDPFEKGIKLFKRFLNYRKILIR